MGVLYAAMPYPPSKALIKFLEPFDRPVRELALAARELVLEEMEPCVEPMYDAYNAVALGYGSSERLKDGVCRIAVYARHVNIGFNNGAELDNKKCLLEVSGRRVRHITIKTPADLQNPAVRGYLRAAYELAGMKQATHGLQGVTSVVKAIYARKRRPVKKAIANKG
jgi:Domain of unknown function (DU1801)